MTEGPLAGAYLASKLLSLDAKLLEVVPRVTTSTADADAVHDLRVFLRRTRTLLALGYDVFGHFHTGEVRSALRDLQQATGALRDEEVLLELVESLRLEKVDMQAWLAARRARERRLRRALARSIHAGDLERGRRLLAALLTFRVNPARDKALAKFARRAVLEARRRVERKRGASVDDPLALHDLRIAYKKLRYVAEGLAEALPSDLAALAQPAARFQSRLGAVHDVDIALASVRRARSLSEEARAALLSALERTREQRIAAYAKEAGLERPPLEVVAQA